MRCDLLPKGSAAPERYLLFLATHPGSEPVHGAIGVGSGVAVGICHTQQVPIGIIPEDGGPAQGVHESGEPGETVVGAGGGVAERIGEAGDLVAGRVVGEGAGVAKRVGDGRDVAAGTVSVPSHPAERIGGGEHLSS